MRITPYILAGTLAGALAVGPSGAFAQSSGFAPSSAGEPAYRALVENGLREFATGNYQEALTSFEQAAQIRRGGRVMRGIAKVRFELRQYAAAVDACAESLAAALDPLTFAQRTEVDALLQRALAYTGTVTLRIAPGDAEVLFDGRPLTPAQRAGAFRADVGAHTVDIAASGYAAQRRTVDVPGGGNAQLVVVALVPAGGARSNPLLWVSVGTGLASAGGVIGASVWLIDRTDMVARCQQALDRGGNCTNGVALASERDVALWSLVGSSVLLAASAVTFGAIVGTSNRREVRPGPPTLACAPLAGGGLCAAGVTW